MLFFGNGDGVGRRVGKAIDSLTLLSAGGPGPSITIFAPDLVFGEVSSHGLLLR